MRLPKALLSIAVVVHAADGCSWFSKAVYNKWQEIELDRWLADHDIPHPSPADRKDLEKLVQENWNTHVVAPYKFWDADTLTDYLKQKGVDVQDATAASKDALLTRVKDTWYETQDKAESAWDNVKDWILDTWTDSQLKSFCDRHDIPVPRPRQRDTLLQQARSNYETIAKKAGETAAYPGNWLYETWSDSDLKHWLDNYGVPVPQPSNRDKLIAAVRRNSRLAHLKVQDLAARSFESADSAQSYLTDSVIDAWSESQLKAFCDKHGISVPQGTKTNQLRALIRKHRASLVGDTVPSSAEAAFGAATSNVIHGYTAATSAASQTVQEGFDEALNMWSESRLKGFLDARGVPIPQDSTTDELRALARKNSHKATTSWSAWTFDDWSLESLKNYLAQSGNAALKKSSERVGVTRDELVREAQDAYTSASASGGAHVASATSYLAHAIDAADKSAFDTWSESELKSYLDSYSLPVNYHGSTINELRAQARKQYTYFNCGTTTPTQTILARLSQAGQDGWAWVSAKVGLGAQKFSQGAQRAGQKTKEDL